MNIMCEYFIFIKPFEENINDDRKNKIIVLQDNMYILPKNNLTYYLEHGLFEKDIIEWCKQFGSKDKNMLDIGAHSGTYSISLAKYFGHIYAFEPQKMSYYALCGSVALSNLNNINCINIGLGSEEQVGKQILNIISLDGGGSTLHISDTNIVQNTEQIEIRTLDSFNLTDISFIKLDVENNEYQVLFSGKNTLKKSNYPKILFEMNIYNEKLVDLLMKLNYQIYSIIGYNNMFLASQNNKP